MPPGQLDRVRGKDSGVVAFDKLTGAVRYQTSDELASYAGPTLAKIAGRDWCFVFARGGLLALNPANGKIDFHFPWRASDSRKRECQQPDRRRRPGAHFRNLRPWLCGVKGKAGRLRRRVERQGQSPRQAIANALEHADLRGRIRLRFERPAPRKCRAALRRAEARAR